MYRPPDIANTGWPTDKLINWHLSQVSSFPLYVVPFWAGHQFINCAIQVASDIHVLIVLSGSAYL